MERRNFSHLASTNRGCIRRPFSRRNICRTTGVGAYAGHVACPKYYENLSWGPHYTETICHPLGIHLKPFTDVSGHKTAQKLSKIKKNGWQNFNDGGIYFFFCQLPGIFLLIFFLDPSWGTPLGCPWWLWAKRSKNLVCRNSVSNFSMWQNNLPISCIGAKITGFS